MLRRQFSLCTKPHRSSSALSYHTNPPVVLRMAATRQEWALGVESKVLQPLERKKRSGRGETSTGSKRKGKGKGTGWEETMVHKVGLKNGWQKEYFSAGGKEGRYVDGQMDRWNNNY